MCDKFSLFMRSCPSFHPAARAVPYGRFPGIPDWYPVSARARGSTSKSTRPCTPHCQRHPHPPLRTRPLPSPTPSTRRSTPGAAVRVRPPAVAQGCGLVGRRVGRRIQVQMHGPVRFPPTAPAHATGRRRGSPRASSRSSLGPILRVELRGCGCLRALRKSEVARNCGPPEMNCTS